MVVVIVVVTDVEISFSLMMLTAGEWDGFPKWILVLIHYAFNYVDPRNSKLTFLATWREIG